MKKNRITELFGIQYPIVQGGMVWCSGSETGLCGKQRRRTWPARGRLDAPGDA